MKRKSTFKTAAAHFFAVILLTVFFLAATLAASAAVICRGPSEDARNLFVTTVLESGNMKWAAGLFLSEKTIQEIVNGNSMASMEQDSDDSLIEVDAIENPDKITVEKIEGNNFTATLMTVNDPSRVFVGTTYPWGEYGKELHELVESNGAIAGVNGGIYIADMNKGGHPIGPVVSRGEIQNMTGTGTSGLVLIGMSEENKLKIIDLAGKSKAQIESLLKEEKIRDAICFQEEASDKNNHFVKLVINGEKREMNGLGSGANPRTAIGQTGDGRILLLVTDGRGANGHLGATASDLIDIMTEHGAVNAANLDGGSSTSMYYNGEYLRTSVTFYYSNSSWKIPDGFLVR